MAERMPDRSLRRATHRTNGVRRRGLVVYLTESEHALLAQHAQNVGRSKSRVLRDAAFGELTVDNPVTALDVQTLVTEFRSYRRNLEGIATNLNQIAHHANTVSEIPATFAAVVGRVETLADDLDALIAEASR